ncbi:hypothetical protein VCR17J2_380087 [Vibrio coralliirubri]|nr:hypothetical protein VCR17J2_380087 [Vibrio coralliirubri]
MKPHLGGAFCYLAFIALTNRKTRSINVLFPPHLIAFLSMGSYSSAAKTGKKE